MALLSDNPEFVAMSAATRTANYRARQKEKGEPDVTRKFRKEHKSDARRWGEKPLRNFVGCDGEGCGTDELGRQLYMLFRMGERELFTGKHLRTDELLTFICDDPRGTILVGFAFGYDVTMILRDLPEKQQRKLFEPKVFGAGFSRYVWYKNFDIEYLPKQYLRVRRVHRSINGDGRERRKGIPGSQRTIYETFGFFQKSFIKVLDEFKVGTELERRTIAVQKSRRSEFTEITQEERDYCALECKFLAELMDKLRTYCTDAGIIPRTWSGAGKLAAALHKQRNTPTRDECALWVGDHVDHLANMAYYGGRFEITRTGMISEPVYEYDIRSAYPDAMRSLPCLRHGEWRRANAKELKTTDKLFVAPVNFKGVLENGGIGQLGALPVRTLEGHLCWPLKGNGVYWSPEIRSAERRGVSVSCKAGYIYERKCECDQFGWVNELFEFRKRIGSSGPGYPIKLGTNSLYGKLAQRKGNGVYNCMIWAGLITALTRSKLNDAVSLNPAGIIMLATDALYSTAPLKLPVGDALGEWDKAELASLFIVQPGLYWDPSKRGAKDQKRKSRGLPGKFFEADGLTESFEIAWRKFEGECNASGFRGLYPSVSVPVPGFIGLKLALGRNKPETAGRWVDETRSIDFDPRNKRHEQQWNNGHIVTGIKRGSGLLVSLPHRDFLKGGGAEPWEAVRAMLEEQPDWIDFSAPYED